MFDVIGKKKWFFTFSGLITIPGFIFILLTPLTGGKDGLQFTIDYTGGTVWELKFKKAQTGSVSTPSPLDIGSGLPFTLTTIIGWPCVFLWQPSTRIG